MSDVFYDVVVGNEHQTKGEVHTMASELLNPTDTTLIDTDIHNGFKDPRDLLPFLAKPWHKQWLSHGSGVGSPYYSTVGVLRRDAIPDNGGSSGSDPAYMIKDHLD